MAAQDPIQRLGWYGKIPAAGDFVHRHLPRELIAWWDKWLQHGLAALKGQDDVAARGFAAAPLWNFAIPAGPGAGAVQFGCITPSRDRVGRYYPLCVTLHLAPDAYQPRMLEVAGAYYRDLGSGLLMAVRHGCSPEQLDRSLQGAREAANIMLAPLAAPAWTGGSDIMDILNAGRATPEPSPVHEGPAWRDLSLCFNPGSHTSYWWTNQADGAPLQTYLHGGALNTTLFGKLFSSLAGVRR
jgi:type VI secretion system protein ImpM